MTPNRSSNVLQLLLFLANWAASQKRAVARNRRVGERVVGGVGSVGLFSFCSPGAKTISRASLSRARGEHTPGFGYPP